MLRSVRALPLGRTPRHCPWRSYGREGSPVSSPGLRGAFHVDGCKQPPPSARGYGSIVVPKAAQYKMAAYCVAEYVPGASILRLRGAEGRRDPQADLTGK